MRKIWIFCFPLRNIKSLNTIFITDIIRIINNYGRILDSKSKNVIYWKSINNSILVECLIIKMLIN